jgi:uncharacterized protein (DUF4415 family)
MPKTLNKTVVFNYEPGDPLTPEQKVNIIKLIENPKRDEDIDLSDAPEIPDDAVLVHFRPRKTTVTIRLDSDVLAWLKSAGEGYQTRVNELLRKAMNTSRAATR